MDVSPLPAADPKDIVITHVPAWCSVLPEIDEMASAPATIDLLAMLTSFMQPKVVVEAGTYRGHAALAVANVMRAYDSGHLYTADVYDNFSATLADIPILQPYITWWHGDYLAMLEQVPGEIDLAYIDASDPNDSNLRLEHAGRTYARLAPGGLLLADDTGSPDWREAKLFRVWAQSSGIHLTQRRGLTFIQKPNA